MKVTIDTNVLIRAVVCDDPKQAKTAQKILKEAALIAISLPCLCKFVWVLSRVYNVDNKTISSTIRTLLNTEKITMNRPAVEAGLALLEAGGDFVDGIMEYEGTWLGGETFISFDKEAVILLSKQGKKDKIIKIGSVDYLLKLNFKLNRTIAGKKGDSEMSKLTVAEKKWLNKLQKVLNECPFNRLGYSSLATWLL